MRSTAGGDSWNEVLAYRDPAMHEVIATRLDVAGLGPDDLAAVLADGGAGLHAASRAGGDGWPLMFGGALGVALLAAEVSALSAHLSARAAAVRGRAVDELLGEHSAVAVAAALGVSRQKVYDIGRTGRSPE